MPLRVPNHGQLNSTHRYSFGTLFPSRVSGWGYGIGSICVPVSVCLSALSWLNGLKYDLKLWGFTANIGVPLLLKIQEQPGHDAGGASTLRRFHFLRVRLDLVDHFCIAEVISEMNSEMLCPRWSPNSSPKWSPYGVGNGNSKPSYRSNQTPQQFYILLSKGNDCVWASQVQN